jgi:nucleotide-binding universal stress UspA family protein
MLDSLPLLRLAETVFVVAVGEDDRSKKQQDSAADVAAYLVRHGAAITTVLGPEPEGSAADRLQRTAKQEEVDLIVGSRPRQYRSLFC